MCSPALHPLWDLLFGLIALLGVTPARDMVTLAFQGVTQPGVTASPVHERSVTPASPAQEDQLARRRRLGRARTAKWRAAKQLAAKASMNLVVTQPVTAASPPSNAPPFSLIPTAVHLEKRVEEMGSARAQLELSLRLAGPQQLVTPKAVTQPGEKNGRAPRGSRLAEDWQPGSAEIQFALGLGLEPAAVAEQFRDYWHSAAGKRATKVDWPATWRVWCRREAGDRRSGRRGSVEDGPGNSQVARAIARARSSRGAA